MRRGIVGDDARDALGEIPAVDAELFGREFRLVAEVGSGGEGAEGHRAALFRVLMELAGRHPVETAAAVMARSFVLLDALVRRDLSPWASRSGAAVWAHPAVVAAAAGCPVKKRVVGGAAVLEFPACCFGALIEEWGRSMLAGARLAA